MPALPTENRNVVRNIYDAFARGDLETAASFFSDKLVLHEPESLPYGGVYSGLQEVGSIVSQIARRLDLSKLTIERLVGDGDDVVALVTASWNGDNGKRTEARLSEWFTFLDRKVVEIRAFYWDVAALNATLD